MTMRSRGNGDHHPSTAVFLYNKIPIRDNYKDTRDQAVKLKAPIEITRGCFLFEIAVFLLSFALFYYYSYNTTTKETTITYEPLGGEYNCQILSPLSTGVSLSTTYSEIAMYSSARYNYDTCISKLGTTDLDVCSDDHRHDYVLTASGASASDTNCYDLILSSNYRFCYIESVTDYDSGYNIKQFPTMPTPGFPYTDVFVFINDSSVVKVVSAGFSQDDILSEIVSDGGYNVYCIAKPSAAGSSGQSYLFQLNAISGQSKQIIETTWSTFYGFTFGNGLIYAYTIDGYTGKIHAIDVDSGVDTVYSVDCSAYRTSAASVSDASTYRYIDYGDDGNLYVMCTGSTFTASAGTNGQTTITSTTYTFLKVDPVTFSSTEMNAGIYALNGTMKDGTSVGKPLDQVSQILFRSNTAYAYCGGGLANIVAINYSPQPTVQPTGAPSTEPNFGFSMSQVSSCERCLFVFIDGNLGIGGYVCRNF